MGVYIILSCLFPLYLLLLLLLYLLLLYLLLLLLLLLREASTFCWRNAKTLIRSARRRSESRSFDLGRRNTP